MTENIGAKPELPKDALKVFTRMDAERKKGERMNAGAFLKDLDYLDRTGVLASNPEFPLYLQELGKCDPVWGKVVDIIASGHDRSNPKKVLEGLRYAELLGLDQNEKLKPELDRFRTIYQPKPPEIPAETPKAAVPQAPQPLEPPATPPAEAAPAAKPVEAPLPATETPSQPGLIVRTITNEGIEFDTVTGEQQSINPQGWDELQPNLRSFLLEQIGIKLPQGTDVEQLSFDQLKELARKLLPPSAEVVEAEKQPVVIEMYAGTLANEKHPESNGDAYFIRPDLGTFGVFDGSNYTKISQQASSIVQDFLTNHLKPNQVKLFEDFKSTISAELIKSSTVIYSDSTHLESGKKVLTTTVSIGCIWQGPNGERKIVIGNVGDSRVYLLRNGELEQITLDDNCIRATPNEEAARQLQAKLSNTVNPEELSDKEQALFLQRPFDLQILEGDKEVRPNIYIVDILSGDRLLACTDGVSDNLTDIEIADILNKNYEGKLAVSDLIKACQERSRTQDPKYKDRRRYDNMTAVVVDILLAETQESRHTQKEQTVRLVREIATLRNIPVEEAWKMLTKLE